MTRDLKARDEQLNEAMHHFSRRVLLRRITTVGASVGALSLLAACGSSAVEVSEEATVTRIPVEGAPTDVPSDVQPGASPATGDGQVAEESPPSDEGAAAGGGGETVELEAYDIGWTQETLTVPVGGTIDIYNSGAAEHNFAVEGYNDDDPVDLPAGGEVVEWPVPDDLAPGDYVYYCEVPGHRASGMEGLLTVTEAGAEAAPAEGAASPAADQAAAGSSTVQLEAYDIGWTQTELTVPTGGAIEMTNVGSAEHNFAIDDYQNGEVLQDIPIGGDPVTWQLPADLLPGTYTFFCEIPGHRQVGMEGTLTIVEATGDSGAAAEGAAAGTPEASPAEGAAETSPAAATAEASPAAGTPAASGGETVELEGFDIGWTQSTLSVPVGGTINMYNSGVAEHNFAVEGYNDDDPVDLPVGGEIVEWPVPDDLAPGDYVFYCEVPGHRASGMEGVLTITEAGAAPAEEAGSPAAEQAVEGSSTVQLEGFDIGWTQTELEVPSGGAIEMTNIGVAEHNFAIDDYQNGEVLQDIPIGGEPVTWQVPDDLAPGTYTFFCDVPGHRASGMEGTLTIV